MTYENFLKIILMQEVLDEQINEAYKLKIDLIEFVARYDQIISILITEIYGEDGYEWYSWFCYENDYGRKNWGVKAGEIQYGATDENGNPICHSFETLWEYLEENYLIINKEKSKVMKESKQEYISLYDFLGKAAGKELGAKVYSKSKDLDIIIHYKKISNKIYKGIISLYPTYFLEQYFKDNKQPLKHVVVSLSGGMDSSTLLLRCLKEYDTVTAISFDYGQKHRVELDRAESLVGYLNGCSQKAEQDLLGTITVTGENFTPINYRQIQLNGLSDLLDSALVTGGEDVPEGHYAEDNMKATVVPNRNKIFASITQAVALSVAQRTGESCDIALGIHAGDHAIYPDCRQEFRDADDNAFRLGNWGSEKVGYFTPYLKGDKFTILQDGEVLCKELGLDFDEVYSRTNTSYKPIWIPIQKLTGISGNWYSDYKSASSVERIEAFIKLGRPDPVDYADETGPVSWETAKLHVEKIINNHNK